MFDAIIVGAGPSGNMAALELATRGFSVAVLDWRTSIGDKLCTGIIGKECAALWTPTQDHIYGEARSATVVSPYGTRYRIECPSAQAYIVDRVAYVNSVAERAQQAGAEYILNTRVTDIHIAGSNVRLTARAEEDPTSYTCRIIILASGFGSPLLRLVGLKNDPATDYLVGCQVNAAAPNLTETEVHLGSATTDKSFAWLVPLSDSRALVGMAPRRRIDGQMARFLSRLQSEDRISEVADKPRTWGIPIRPLSPSYADRTLVAGDAAGLVKPTTGGGIYYSFLSGQIAAEAAHEAITSGKYAAKDLHNYERNWTKIFGRELRIGYYARLLFETLNDEQIERLLDEFLSDAALADYIGEDIAFDWHSKVILKALRHTNIMRVLATLGPSAAPFVARLTQANS
jgi:geranylgeranyl reductase family protein